MSALKLLNELHQRFDGTVPPHLLARAMTGGKNLDAIHAEANAAFYKDQAVAQIRTIRKRHASGTFYPSLITDLRIYISAARRYRRQARLARAAAGR